MKRAGRTRALEPVVRRVADWPFLGLSAMGWPDGEELRVEEYREDGSLVIRLDMPGIDPDKDVEIEVDDGVLHVSAERRKEERVEEKDYVRTEVRYGALTRALPLPAGAREQDIAATYRDGVLEIRVPVAETPAAETKKIPITRS